MIGEIEGCWYCFSIVISRECRINIISRNAALPFNSTEEQKKM